MARIKTSFFCTECGHEASGWLGRCPGCGAWNTLVEEKNRKKHCRRRIMGFGPDKRSGTGPAGRCATTAGRLSSGIGEFGPGSLGEADLSAVRWF